MLGLKLNHVSKRGHSSGNNLSIAWCYIITITCDDLVQVGLVMLYSNIDLGWLNIGSGNGLLSDHADGTETGLILITNEILQCSPESNFTRNAPLY